MNKVKEIVGQFREYVPMMRKAIVPVVVAMVVAGMASLGIDPDMTIREVVDMVVASVVTGFFVWLVPNEK